MLVLGACAKSLDMSGEQIPMPGPDEGIVVGSLLVQAEQQPPDSWVNRWFGRKAAGFTYEFEIVRIQTTDSKGEEPYTERYELDAKPGEERTFIARLKAGDYLIKGFYHEGLSAMGGRLGVMFSVAPGTTRYIGRLLVEVPRTVTMGTGFTYRVEDARETTLIAIQKQHPEVTRRVVDSPMYKR